METYSHSGHGAGKTRSGHGSDFGAVRVNIQCVSRLAKSLIPLLNIISKIAAEACAIPPDPLFNAFVVLLAEVQIPDLKENTAGAYMALVKVEVKRPVA